MLRDHEGIDLCREEFLGELAARVEEARRAVAASSAALERLERALATAERRISAISAAAEPPPSAALVPVNGRAAAAGEAGGLLDVVVDRVDQLRGACEELLKRPLRAYERPIILEWAQLERDGHLVPVPEILALASRVLARPTRDGTLPPNLRWCDETVQTLRRQSGGAVRWSPTAERSVEYAALYERLADELDLRRAGG
jgi:hypothetical protein